MTKKIFRSILLTAFVTLLTSLIVILSGLYGYFDERQADLLRQELALAVQGVELSGRPYLEGAGTQACRLTWIGPDGAVLYDTQAPASTLENHGERKEVREALETGTGSASRVSATLTRRTVYRAQRLSDGTVLRASADQVTALALLLWMFQPILLLVVIAAVVSAALADRLSKKIVEPINALDLDDPLSNDVYEELTPLLRRVHQQRAEIESQVTALRERSDELAQITAGMREGLVLLNERSVILHLNPAAQAIFQTDADCVGRELLELDRGPDMSRAVQEALASGHGELRETREDREYQLDVSRIESEGRVIGAAVLIFDVTERSAAERSRREFTANVSHELKTPLQSIIGSAELLENGMVTESDVPRFVGRIRAEAQRLVALIEDILRLSQLDEGAEMALEEVELLALAREAAGSLSSQAAAKEVRLTVDGRAAAVTGARPLLYEMLYNLCDNAIKYNVEGGSVEVTVTPGAGEAALTVRDTGIGIPAQYQERVFERFFRVDKSRSKERGGTGLGLSIVKHAVRSHGGRIRLESVPGQGTTVTVTLPAGPENRSPGS